jgi:modulator of FtsH protease HflK
MNETHEDIRHEAIEPVGPPPMPPPGPIAQSVAIGFRSIYIAILFLGAVWLASNVRQIPPDSQAVVMRFGKIVRTQSAGLLIGWPRPIEQVYLLPGKDRLLSQTAEALPSDAGIAEASTDAVPTNTNTYLTGDGGVVLISATMVYRVTDPQAYLLAETHIAPALNRAFHATAVRVTAGRGLNDFLVARTNSETGGTGQAASPLSAAVRDELLTDVNRRLKDLGMSGYALGIEVDRIDLTAQLPPVAKTAFDSVLTATQAADQNVATARTAAERRRQGAERERDRLVTAARAAAVESIAAARVDTASIGALEKEINLIGGDARPRTRNTLIQQVYRDRVSGIVGRVGSMILVDPQSGVRFVMPPGR